METWEMAGYLGLLVSILTEKSIDKSLVQVRTAFGDKRPHAHQLRTNALTKSKIEKIKEMVRKNIGTKEIARELNLTDRQVQHKRWELKKKGLIN